MTWLLDTNACIELLNEQDSPIARKLARVAPQEIVICSVVKAELYHGAQKSSKREANLNLLAKFFQQFASLPFDDSASEQYGQLRAVLEKQGMLIGPNDLLIASVALANGLTLVTHNVEEFKRLPALRMEDWQI